MSMVGYMRVSTASQAMANGCDMQHDALKQAGVERIFQETASGASRERPALKACLDWLREGDTLCVYSLSRLGRTVRQLVVTIEDLEQKGIAFRSLREHIDTGSGPMGRMSFHIFAAVAQAERDILRERVKDGLAAARARGKVGGQKKKMTASRIKAAEAMLEANEMTVADIARCLGVGLSTLYREFPGAKSLAGRWPDPTPLTTIPPGTVLS